MPHTPKESKQHSGICEKTQQQNFSPCLDLLRPIDLFQERSNQKRKREQCWHQDRPRGEHGM